MLLILLSIELGIFSVESQYTRMFSSTDLTITNLPPKDNHLFV